MSRDLIAEPASGAGPPAVAPSMTAPSRWSWWLASLVSLLGIFEVLMATSAGSTSTRVIGLLGGVALIAAPWLTGGRRHRGLPLILIGTVPFAVVTWWTLVTPLLAVVALAIGIPLARRRR